MTDIRVGDWVRVLDTEYTRRCGEHIRRSIGKVGAVTGVHDYTDVKDTVGFDTLYDVEVRSEVCVLIRTDIELVERPARIQ